MRAGNQARSAGTTAPGRWNDGCRAGKTRWRLPKLQPNDGFHFLPRSTRPVCLSSSVVALRSCLRSAPKERWNVATGEARSPTATERNPWRERHLSISPRQGRRRRTIIFHPAVSSIDSVAVSSNDSVAPPGQTRIHAPFPRVPLRFTPGYNPAPLRGDGAASRSTPPETV